MTQQSNEEGDKQSFLEEDEKSKSKGI